MLSRTMYAVIALLAAVFCATASEAADRKPQPTPARTAQYDKAAMPGGSVQTVAQRNWRYRWHNNHWWYWTPRNRWMIYYNNGWLPYDAATYYNYYPSYGYSYSYPSYGYGYYPSYGYYGYGYPYYGGYYRRGWYGPRFGIGYGRGGWRGGVWYGGGRYGWGGGWRGGRRWR